MSVKPVRAADHVECQRNPSPASAITPCTPEARTNSRPARAAVHVMCRKNRIPHPHERGTGRKPAWALSLARNPWEIEAPHGLFALRQELQQLQADMHSKPARDCDENLPLVPKLSSYLSKAHTKYRLCQSNMILYLIVEPASSIYYAGFQPNLPKLILQGTQHLTWFMNTNLT